MVWALGFKVERGRWRVEGGRCRVEGVPIVGVGSCAREAPSRPERTIDAPGVKGTDVA